MIERPPGQLVSRAGTLALRRAWPRGDGHLLCEYVSADGAPVAGQWFADRGRLRAVADATGGDVELRERAGVLLQRGGADRRLTALRALVAEPGTTLIVHRPERRAVVRRDRDATYTKVVRPGRAAELVARAAHVPPAVRTPAALACDDGRGIVVWAELEGRPLYALGAAPGAIAGWRSAGRGLACLHDATAAGIPTHRAADEAALVRRWLARAAALGLAPRVDPAPALAALLDEPPGPLGLLHRDLHDKQLLHRPGAPIGLLDLDTLAVGERALDLANLLVHLELRVRQGRRSPTEARAAADALLEGYRPDRATRRRLDAYATAARLRLAAVYAFRPRWRALAHHLLAGPRPVSHSAPPSRQ